jgi:hypothetical protein
MGSLPETIGSAATLSSTGFMRLAPDRIRLPAGKQDCTASLPESFVNSIRDQGILQPILIRKIDTGYELVAGARRLAAAQALNLVEVPVVLIQATDDQAVLIARMENEQRRNPFPDSTVPPVPATLPVPVVITSTAWRIVIWVAAQATLVLAAMWLGWVLSGNLTTPPAQIVISPTEHPGTAIPPSRSLPEPLVEERPVITPEAFSKFIPHHLLLETTGASLRLVLQAPAFSYRTTLDPDTLPLLRELGAIIAPYDGQCVLLITGHTDANPMRGSSIYRDNDELGLARAAEVARFLRRQAGVPSGMIRIATAGSKNPPFESDTPESARRNRTITFLLTPSGTH